MYSIILVDDDRFILEQLVKTIDWHSYNFDIPPIFTDGRSALSYIQHNIVHAIITDIKMDGVDGLELAKICQSQFPNICIAIISAHRDFEYARKAIKYGVIEYITKPILFEDFTACVQSLGKAVADQQQGESGSDIQSNIIMKAIAYMNEHISEPITLNNVASHIGFHPNYFSKYFKEHTGENFLTFLTKLRISRAKHLLRNTDLKISAICDQIGYKNKTHFYDTFREQSGGLTPLQYKNEIKKRQVK